MLRNKPKFLQQLNLIDSIRELVCIYFLALCLGAAVFSVFENKAFWDAFWWASVTATTVGYGDFYPVTWQGRVAAFCLMHFTLLFILPLLIGNICNTFIKNQNEFTDAEQEEMKQYLRAISADLAETKAQMAKLSKGQPVDSN